MYEFMRGLRLITKQALNDCENPISDFFVDTSKAQALLNNTKTSDDVEGVF